MAKAIVGPFGNQRTLALLDEVRALRARVAQLEAALEVAESRLDDRVVELETSDLVAEVR